MTQAVLNASRISSGGTVAIDAFTTAGVVHNDTSGNLSSSLIVNADVDPAAAIVDTKLATISTAGKVANSATTATSSPTGNTIVLRDSSGNFSANVITANLTGNVTGAASLNVLKTGDSMTGTLSMLSQNAVHFNNATNSGFVGINAPTSVPSSYTLSLPSTIPTATQVLTASTGTPTQLEWVTNGGSIPPATSRTIYVTTYGNDTTGNGSLTSPYLTLSKAITVANSLASTTDPICIAMSPGIYVEDNSGGPLTITAGGISIVGENKDAVFVQPNTLSNDLLSITTTAGLDNITFMTTGGSTANGIALSGAANESHLSNLTFISFGTGVTGSGSGAIYIFNTCLFVTNGTALSLNNVLAICNNCSMEGSTTPIPANTGITATGAASSILIGGGICTNFTTALTVSGGATLASQSTVYKNNTNSVVSSGSAQTFLEACFFEPFSTAPVIIDVQASGAGTVTQVAGCIFNATAIAGSATAVQVTNEASVSISGGQMSNYTTALAVGTSGDTSSTTLTATGLLITNCTSDIVQQGTASLNFNAGTASSSKLTINDSTNVKLAYFDNLDNNILKIGKLTDTDTTVLKALIATVNSPEIAYKSSLYSTQALGYQNSMTGPASLFALGNNATNVTAITTDRTQTAGLRLVSDTGSPVGNATGVRGWDITKNGASAELAFSYQNTDPFGQSVVTEYPVMQLSGVSNQLQLPTIGTQIVFAGDTNLYRFSTGTLQTDGNVIVGGLTANTAVATNGSKQLVSSVTTATELGYLSGTTSSVQTQINSKVAKAGDTMTGTLQLPAGTAANPSLTFTGSTTTGLSAATANRLSFDTNGVEAMSISSAGTVAINQFSPTAGVVHNDINGNLTSSLIVNGDIAANAGIIDTKLNTISSAGKVLNSATTATSASVTGTIVARDGSGNFAANVITANLIGNVTGNVFGNIRRVILRVLFMATWWVTY